MREKRRGICDTFWNAPSPLALSKWSGGPKAAEGCRSSGRFASSQPWRISFAILQKTSHAHVSVKETSLFNQNDFLRETRANQNYSSGGMALAMGVLAQKTY
jgi:hypothetical protein